MSKTTAWRKEHNDEGEDIPWELWQHDSSAPKGYDETCLGYFYTEKAIDKVLALEGRVRAAEAGLRTVSSDFVRDVVNLKAQLAASETARQTLENELNSTRPGRVRHGDLVAKLKVQRTHAP